MRIQLRHSPVFGHQLTCCLYSFTAEEGGVVEARGGLGYLLRSEQSVASDDEDIRRVVSIQQFSRDGRRDGSRLLR